MAKGRIIRAGILGLGRAGTGMIAKEVTGTPDRFRLVAGADPLSAPQRRTRGRP